MTEYKPITHEKSMKLSKDKFLDRCKAWLELFNNNKPLKLDSPSQCPLHIWVQANHRFCGKELIPNLSYCKICGEPCCPDCSNHNVSQISRVTGYMSDIAGWNNAKQQELADRVKHTDF